MLKTVHIDDRTKCYLKKIGIRPELSNWCITALKYFYMSCWGLSVGTADTQVILNLQKLEDERTDG